MAQPDTDGRWSCHTWQDRHLYAVEPLDDVIEHRLLSRACLCGPRVDLQTDGHHVLVVGIVHHPWDGRREE